jgi:outer membrane protein assembly factor BamB
VARKKRRGPAGIAARQQYTPAMRRQLAWFSVVCVGLVGLPLRAQWPQWGGPTRDFHAPAAPLADTWPTGGPRVIWSRPLGTGHSAIAVDDGRLFTLARAGNARAKLGPWSTDEAVVALDAKTGATIWEHHYPARTGYEDFSFGPGPHATPLVVGDRLFSVGTNQQLFAFDKRTGKVLWSHDFVKEFKSPELLLRPNVKTGYGCSPIAYGDMILCSVGGPGQSVMAFRQSDGAVVWRSGDFLTSSAAPIMIELDGRPQAVFFAGSMIAGLDPMTGAILWAHPHDPGNDLNCGTPLFGPDNVLFMSSAYQAGSRAIRLVPRGTQSGGPIDTEELWFTNRVRFMFLSSIRIGDFVYGTTGDFGPAFLTALNVKTGESPWQVRGFARASLVAADGKVIVMNEDGDLALARLSPTGAEILARAKVFDTTTWTVPTLVGTTLYARDREKIVALDLGVPGAPAATPPVQTPPRFATTRTGSAPRVATPADLSGAWRLDTTGSTITAGAGLAGLHPNGAPAWMFVTQPLNGTVILESATNASQSRFYRPGKSTTTATAGGTITMATSWSGVTLVAEGQLTTSGGAVTAIKEVLSRTEDALVIQVTAGDTTSRLRYIRLTDTGACGSWPNPCKKSPGME